MSEQIEIYENDLLFYLNEFCEVNKIEDIKKESQSVWNSALYYIQKKLFDINYFKSKENYKLDNGMYKESNFNSYNFELVMYVLDIYIYDMCMKYDKEVSILGFSSLTGIPDSTIYDWGKNTLSPIASEILEKLRKYQEESLSNKLVTGAKNPVGVIAILNRRYGWASPYTSDSRQTDRQTDRLALTEQSISHNREKLRTVSRQDMTVEYQTCGQMETWLLKDMGETAEKQIDVAVTLRARDYKGLDNYGSNGVIEWKN